MDSRQASILLFRGSKRPRIFKAGFETVELA
jgi:hypothetical protein